LQFSLHAASPENFLYTHGRPISPGIMQQIMPTSYNYGSLGTLTIVCLTPTKFEPFVFSALSFSFAYVSNIHIIMILYDFCLFHAYFGHIIVNVRNWEREVSSSGHCAPEKLRMVKRSILQAL